MKQPTVGTPDSSVGLGIAALAFLLATPYGLSAQVEASDAARDEADATAVAVSTPTQNTGTEQYGLLPDRPRVTPTRVAVRPEIDGVLDDEAWVNAAHITEFTQESPIEGAPATEETDVYIAYDDDNIYFGFHVHYEDPSIMRANRVQRDSAAQDDLMTIYFDTFLDQQTGYDFDVNGYGVQGDGVMSASRGGNRGTTIPPADRSWDALFESAGQIVEDGYIAEMAIPFKSLRYPSPGDGEPHRWGFQIVREIKSKDAENLVWSPMSRDESSFFSQMGLLEGMTDISTSRNIEILPTFTAVQYGEIDPTGPDFVNRDADPDAGVNVKYGITPNLTADFTINPDFSQIESDQPQIEVNQRFPLFYSELRPFFLEGSEIFNIQAPVTFVHTRTIVDPDYGAKLSGKVGRVSFGFLTANDRAPGRVEDKEDPAFDETAQTFIARAQVDLASETNIGAIVTDREFLDGYSRLLGVDGNFRLSPTITGDARYVTSFFRDIGEERVGGHMVATQLRQNGRNLSWSLVGYEISPDFETEVGFVRRRDQRTATSNVSYRWWPESWIINWGPSVSYGRTYDFDDVLQDDNFGVGLNFSFARSISFGANYDRDMERFAGTEFEKSGWSIRGNVNTSRSYSIGANLSMGDAIYYSEARLGDRVGWSINGTIRPLDRLQNSLRITSSRLTDPAANDSELFDVKIFRSTTNLQFTDRLGLRNIVEWNTQNETFDFNLLFNYQVNAGTVFYAGYDDHFQQADLIEGDHDLDGTDEQLFFTDGLRRTNRAFFVKLQYLIRY